MSSYQAITERSPALAHLVLSKEQSTQITAHRDVKLTLNQTQVIMCVYHQGTGAVGENKWYNSRASCACASILKA